MFYKSLIKLFFGLFLLINLVVQAQDKSINIYLLDKKLNTPISEANYEYGSQFGISDLDGKISIKFEENAKLKLSHVQYGSWILNEDDIIEAVKEGKIFRDQEIFTLQPVTVIAVHSKTDGKQFLDLGYQDKLSHDGGAILNQEASINSIKKSGSYGFDPVMRGFKYDQLNIVIDGVQCAVAACPNRMDPPTSQVAPNMMKQVEVFKGPHSLRYGSAFGGTINFVSQAPNYSVQNQTYGRISGSSETNGGVLRTEGLFGFSGDIYDIGFLGSFSKGNDYKDGEGEKVPAKFQRASFGMNVGLNIADNQNVKLSVTRNIAENTDFPSLAMDLISDKTTLVNFNHKIDISGKYLKNWNTSLYGTYVDHLMNNYLKDINPRMVDAKTPANTLSFGGRSEGSWLFNKSRLYAGADLRVEKAEGTRTREFLMGPNKGKVLQDNVWNGGKLSKTGIFGEYQHFFSEFKLILSGRLEYNIAKATDLNDSFASKNEEVENTSVNPSFSIGGLFDLSENTTVGLYLGRATRSGSITERYINSFPVGLDPYDMLGNPNLKSEVNNQVDLVLNYNSSSTIIDIGIFASKLDNFISSEIDPDLNPTMPSSPGVRRFVNIKDAFMTGFEIKWNQQLFYSLTHQLSVAYTYGKDNVRDEPLPEIAPLDLRYKLQGSYFENKIRPEITFRHVLKQNRISQVYGETKTPQFSIIDFTLRYKYSSIISLTFGIQNLLDEAYYEHLSRKLRGMERSIYAPGRNLYLSLSLDLM